jgi:hypothetical protein
MTALFGSSINRGMPVSPLDELVSDPFRQRLTTHDALDHVRTFAGRESVEGQQDNLRATNPRRCKLRLECDHHQNPKRRSPINDEVQRFRVVGSIQ